MNKRGVIVLTLFLTLLLGWSSKAYADYNITCERDCRIYGLDTCNEQSNVTVTNQSGTWTYEDDQRIDLLMPFISTPDINGLCNFNASIDQDFMSGTGTANITMRLANASDVEYTEWEDCENFHGVIPPEYIFGRTTDLCYESNASLVYAMQYVIYTSTDDSCSGDVYSTGEIDCGDVFIPNPTWDFQVRYVKHGLIPYDNTTFEIPSPFSNYEQYGNCYSTKRARQVIGVDTYYMNYTTFNCSIPCDYNNYALYIDWINISVTNQWRQSNITNNLTYSYCSNITQNCLIWDTPTNTSLTYSCNCQPSEINYGLFCEEESCYRTCSGTFEEEYYYNETEALEGTLEGALESGDATQVVDYFAEKTIGATTTVTSFIDEYWFPLLVLGLFILLVITGTSFLTGGFR